MDKNQLLNDAEAAQIYALDGRQARIWTAMPGIVQSVDFDAMTAQVQPAIQGVYTADNGAQSYVNLPLLVDVPICFPSAGGFTLALPMKAGDEVLLVIASRCIDAWWQQGGVQPPMEMRMHDLSDGFAIPGPRSQPRVIDAISSTSAQLRNDAGTFYLGLNGTSGLFQMQNPSQSLKGVLDGMLNIQNTLNTALITFSTGLTPVNLATNATALAAALATIAASIATEIVNVGELLE